MTFDNWEEEFKKLDDEYLFHIKDVILKVFNERISQRYRELNNNG